jgi:ribosomal protein L28
VAADTWGLSWGGSTGSWLSSWASTFVPPTPDPEPEQVHAGRKTRRRYYVEIDGQQFDVESANEAQQILERARALAEVAAESAAKKVQAKAARAKKPRPIRLAAPKVTASPELRLDLAPIRRDIARIYDDAAALAELRLLLQRAIEDDEEETLLLLM